MTEELKLERMVTKVLAEARQRTERLQKFSGTSLSAFYELSLIAGLFRERFSKREGFDNNVFLRKIWGALGRPHKKMKVKRRRDPGKKNWT